jgi:voltage-gated potassium channel
MAQRDRKWMVGLAFTVVLFLLIAAATSEGGTDPFGIVMAVLVLSTIGTLYSFFPNRHLFAIGVANFLALYSALYSFFVESNFPDLPHWAILAGYTVPVISFVVGAWLRREEINRIIAAEEPSEFHQFGNVSRWLVPLVLIATVSFFVSEFGLGEGGQAIVFFAMMAAIGAIVVAVSEDLCTFLLQTSLLFEWFFGRMKALLVPAVGFFVFYSLIVLVFACLYRIVDLAEVRNFVIQGEARPIDFTESLYFSMITLSTVGYGDIVPASPLVRLLVSIEIVSGVLLMLFGFAEFISYGRERAKRQHRE